MTKVARRLKRGPGRLAPKGAGDGPVGIGQERKVEAVLRAELLLARHWVGADPDALCAEALELGGQVSEVAALRSATGREGTGIEEEDDRTFPELGRKLPSAGVVGIELEVRNEVTGLHEASLGAKAYAAVRGK